MTSLLPAPSVRPPRADPASAALAAEVALQRARRPRITSLQSRLTDHRADLGSRKSGPFGLPRRWVMRHFLALALAPTTLTGRVEQPTRSTPLVTSSRRPHRLPTCRGRTVLRAISLAAITGPADLDLQTAAAAAELPETLVDPTPPSPEPWTSRRQKAILPCAIAPAAIGRLGRSG